MKKYAEYLRELEELVEIAADERALDSSFDAFDQGADQYADGFVAGYRQAMRDAATVFRQTF